MQKKMLKNEYVAPTLKWRLKAAASGFVLGLALSVNGLHAAQFDFDQLVREPQLNKLSSSSETDLYTVEPGDEEDEEAEEDAEDAAEEEAETSAEEEAETSAEEEAETSAEEEAETSAEEEAETSAEEEAETSAEEEAETSAEEEAETSAEEEAETSAEEEAETSAEEEAETSAEEEAETSAEEEAETSAEEEAETSAEEEAETSAEEEAEEEAEGEAEEEAEEEAETSAEEEAEEETEDGAEEKAEEEAEEEEAEDVANEAAEPEIENNEFSVRSEETDFEKPFRPADVAREPAVEQQIPAASVRDRQIPSQRQVPLNTVSTRQNIAADRDYAEIVDVDGDLIVADEILILAEKDSEIALDDVRFPEQEIIELEGLGMVLVRARVDDPSQINGYMENLAPQVENGSVDANHIYKPGAEAAASTAYLLQPADLAGSLGLPSGTERPVKIGLIDTSVDVTHPALKKADINRIDFVPFKRARPKAHGTAVAAIMVGAQPAVYKGLSPASSLYAAGVFSESTPGNVVATAESLVRAIDWMVRENISIINMSLSGPANDLLEIAINRAAERGSTVVAAVGNAGPNAKPLYPAAYPAVVAVTAVDRSSRVFLRANRGTHVDFSAPGVEIISAEAGGGYAAKTGTSIAAPFVATILAQLADSDKEIAIGEIVRKLKATAKDLGKPGYDPVYGYGLINIEAD